MISDVIRNTTQQMVRLAQEQMLTSESFRVGCEILMRAAEQVERLEAMEVPPAQRVQVADLADGTVVRLDEYRLQRSGVPVWPGGAA